MPRHTLAVQSAMLPRVLGLLLPEGISSERSCSAVAKRLQRDGCCFFFPFLVFFSHNSFFITHIAPVQGTTDSASSLHQIQTFGWLYSAFASPACGRKGLLTEVRDSVQYVRLRIIGSSCKPFSERRLC